MTKLRFFALTVCITLCGYFWYQSTVQPPSMPSAQPTLSSEHSEIIPTPDLTQIYIHTMNTANLLRNGSFEDVPRHSITPEEWIDWGFEGESPTDIHPTGTFGVVKKANHGDSYLGMVVRDNNTWERVAQKLDQPLQKGKQYKLRGYIARSETYLSVSKLTEQRANYNIPAILKISGKDIWYEKGQLLGQTLPIFNTDWVYFEMVLKPNSNLKYLLLEAHYDESSKEIYNGNILLDGLELIEL